MRQRYALFTTLYVLILSNFLPMPISLVPGGEGFGQGLIRATSPSACLGQEDLPETSLSIASGSGLTSYDNNGSLCLALGLTYNQSMLDDDWIGPLPGAGLYNKCCLHVGQCCPRAP